MKALEYYQEPLPAETDTRLLDIVDRFSSLDAAHRTSFQEALSHSQRAMLGLFSHRMRRLLRFAGKAMSG
ncbi:MAG: hypothetical protein R3C44_06215 [Chloroflexota bacterium]